MVKIWLSLPRDFVMRCRRYELKFGLNAAWKAGITQRGRG